MTPAEIIDQYLQGEGNSGADVIEALAQWGYRIEGRGDCPECGAAEEHALNDPDCHQCYRCPNRHWHEFHDLDLDQ